jgi:DNA primase large subunit
VEEFEVWALDRLRVLAEIESSFVRNRPWDELKTVTAKHTEKHLALAHNTARTVRLDEQRRKDHVSHFVLRLAFCRS